MSDFDKEAERERLREKYEQDQDDRETTERMSELLLKGATMTNAHCGECGDPIFRYEGQNFCPTCQEPVTDADQTGAAAPAEGDADAADGEAAADAPAESDGDTARQDAADVAENGTAGADESAAAERRGVTSGAEPAKADRGDAAPVERTAPDGPTPADAAERSLPAEAGERTPARTREQPAETGATTTGTLGDARASLERSLLRFAREAERADDPRRARECLEAASEAADALAALSEIR